MTERRRSRPPAGAAPEACNGAGPSVPRHGSSLHPIANRAQRRAQRRHKLDRGAYPETARRHGDLDPDELAVLTIMTELADETGRITLDAATFKAALDDPDKLAVLLALAEDAAEAVALT